MKIPKKLKIGGHSYEVKLVEARRAVHMNLDSAGSTSSHRNHVIEIDLNLAQTSKEQTLFHEIFHAINSELEHSLLESLSQQLYQVFKDNDMLK